MVHSPDATVEAHVVVETKIGLLRQFGSDKVFVGLRQAVPGARLPLHVEVPTPTPSIELFVAEAKSIKIFLYFLRHVISVTINKKCITINHTPKTSIPFLFKPNGVFVTETINAAKPRVR
jgi:hypothetical protein